MTRLPRTATPLPQRPPQASTSDLRPIQVGVQESRSWTSPWYRRRESGPTVASGTLINGPEGAATSAPVTVASFAQRQHRSKSANRTRRHGRARNGKAVLGRKLTPAERAEQEEAEARQAAINANKHKDWVEEIRQAQQTKAVSEEQLRLQQSGWRALDPRERASERKDSGLPWARWIFGVNRATDAGEERHLTDQH